MQNIPVDVKNSAGVILTLTATEAPATGGGA
nr:MAG TPA: hypothetical protein [Caudoviricetes sp.]